MAKKAGKKSSTIHPARGEATGTGKAHAETDPGYIWRRSDPPPKPARDWLREAATRLTNAKHVPEKVTDAARLLEKEMVEAFWRHQVGEAYGWGHIKNFLNDENFWPSKRRPKM